MRKLVIMLVAIIAGGSLQAQNFNIESALIEMNRGSLVEAKGYIDDASKNERTSDNAKMWFVRGQVYLAIIADPTQKEVFPDAGVTALQSFINCIKKDMEGKRRSYAEANENMLQAVAPAYNYGINNYQEGLALIESGDKEAGNIKINQAVEAWNVVLIAYDYDPTRQMETVMNLPKNNIIQLMADAAIKTGNNDRAFLLLNDVIASEKPVPYAYTRSALLHMELGDTTKAIAVVEQGRKKFPEEKDLTTLQMMIYKAQGREDLLTDKITEALMLDPENPSLLASRANIYDNNARSLVDDLKAELAIAYTLAGDAKKERDAKKKAELQKQVNASNARVEAILKKVQHLDSLAVADYTKSYEVNPDQFDVVFNLGAVYFNGALPLVEMANNLPANSDYEKNYTALKTKWTILYENALIWFLKAEVLSPDDDAVLMSIQQTYAQLGNQEKSMEYRDKRK